jgi:hypothetical protein
LTITGKTDGFGAQYLAVMSGVAYCASKQTVYVHTAFATMEHDTNVAAMNTFIGIADKLRMYPDKFHIYSHFQSEDHLLQQDVTTHKVTIKPLKLVEDVHYSKYPSIFYSHKVRRKLQHYYYSTPKPTVQIGVVIHIRRGDVDASSGWRFTPNETYIQAIHTLEKKYPGHTIYIFSEGSPNDFVGLRGTLCLNTDIQVAFHSLVCAKVLVMSKSTFSYTSAILNDNTVYYMDFCHKKLDHWKRFEELLDT